MKEKHVHTYEMIWWRRCQGKKITVCHWKKPARWYGGAAARKTKYCQALLEKKDMYNMIWRCGRENKIAANWWLQDIHIHTCWSGGTVTQQATLLLNEGVVLLPGIWCYDAVTRVTTILTAIGKLTNRNQILTARPFLFGSSQLWIFSEMVIVA